MSLVDVPHVLCSVVCGRHLMCVQYGTTESSLVIHYKECEVRVTKVNRHSVSSGSKYIKG